MTAERLTSLYKPIGWLNSVHELQELLDFVIDRALNITGGKRAVLLLGESPTPITRQLHRSIANDETLECPSHDQFDYSSR